MAGGTGLLWLLCLAPLASSGFPRRQVADAAPEISINYEVLEVYPRRRWVLITCHAPQAPRPTTYSLLASRDVQVSRKVVDSDRPASFSINITLKSDPGLLTYFCRAASSSGPLGSSARLQMHWELWAQPVSQLQANLTERGGGPGRRMELSCLATSGSPPITYRLVGKDGRVHSEQTPRHGQPANFSLPLTQMSGWFRCQAANDVSAQSSALKLVSPGEPPPGPTLMLAGSLFSIAAITSGMLAWTRARKRLAP